MSSAKLTVHDAHVHLWSYPPPHPNQLTQLAERIPVAGTPEELLAVMDRVGIGQAAVVTPSAMGWDNSATMAAAQAYPDRLVPVGRVDIEDVWSVVADADVPVALHVLPDQMARARRLVDAHPELTFLLDHLGRLMSALVLVVRRSGRCSRLPTATTSW